MRNKPILILAAVSLMLMISFVSVLESKEATSAAAANYSIRGYVADVYWNPMEGVTVSIMDSQGNVYSSDTDADGFFSVSVSSNFGLSISFSTFGYTIVTCPNTLPPTSEDSNYRPIDLSKAAYTASTGTYALTGPISSEQGAIMNVSLGTVNGHITSNSNSVKNCNVTLAPATNAATAVLGNNALTATTNDQGYYEITGPVGNYTLVVSGQGFKTSDPVPVTISSEPSTVDAAVEEKNMSEKYFGMDTAHLLMLIGVIVGIILAVTAWFLSRRVNDPHGLEIIDDSVDENEDVVSGNQKFWNNRISRK